MGDLPQSQCNMFLEMVKPIKHKCLGLMYGNHQLSYIKRNNFNTVKYMCNQLKCKNLFDKCLVTVNKVKMLFSHGTGGGGNAEGYPLTRCSNIYKFDLGMDIYVIGHLHRMLVSQQKDFYYENNKQKYRKKYYCTNGCYLEKQTIGASSYSQNGSFANASIGSLKIQIDNNNYTVQTCFIYDEVGNEYQNQKI